MVHTMRSGNTLGINCEKACVNFTPWHHAKEYPLHKAWDWSHGREHDNYMAWVKAEERHGLDGVVNNMFWMQDSFHFAIISQNEEDIQKIVDSIPHHDKMLKLVV